MIGVANVQGFFRDRAAYGVKVEPGDVSGSQRVNRLVDLWSGRMVKAGPSGPLLAVSADNPASVVALLGQETAVVSVDGDSDPAPAVGRRVQ